MSRKVPGLGALRALFMVAVSSLLLSACAWHRIDPPPDYQAEKLPITIGLQPTERAKAIALDLQTELGNLAVFDEVVYPLRPDDELNCVLSFDATSTTKGSGAGAGFLTGLTLGLAGTVVGPSVTMTHNVSFQFTDGQRIAGRNAVQVTTKSEFGMGADSTEVARKHAALHTRKLGIAIAQKVQAAQGEILTLCRDDPQQGT